MRALTADIHDKVTSALFSDDNTMSDAAVTMINRRTSFWGSRNIASDAVMLFGEESCFKRSCSVSSPYFRPTEH